MNYAYSKRWEDTFPEDFIEDEDNQIEELNKFEEDRKAGKPWSIEEALIYLRKD